MKCIVLNSWHVSCRCVLMRVLLSIFIFTSIFSKAQTVQDQNVFNNRVWKEVALSSSKKTFYDSKDKYLGSRIETDNAVVYKDKWKRVIKVFPKHSIQFNKEVIENKTVENKKSSLDNANRVVVRRNKATYYDSNGVVERTAKRRGKRKVYFHNRSGKLIGYKIYQPNGITRYKDSRGRITGTSYIDQTGRMIYRPKNRKRRTPRVLFEDPFLFKR